MYLMQGTKFGDINRTPVCAVSAVILLPNLTSVPLSKCVFFVLVCRVVWFNFAVISCFFVWLTF